MNRQSSSLALLTYYAVDLEVAGWSNMKRFILLLLVALFYLSCQKAKPALVDMPSSAGLKTNANVEQSSSSSAMDLDVAQYPHVQTLLFKYSGYDTKVFKDPLGDEVVYVVQKGDKIEISKVIEYKTTRKTFLEIRTPIGETGYIQIKSNPYREGEYSYLESIKVNGLDVKVLKMTQSFSVSDGIFIKELPSESSGNIHEITHAEGAEIYYAMAITSDYKWVKLKFNKYIGWVPADSLSVGKGGPVIDTPEAAISFDLIGSHEI